MRDMKYNVKYPLTAEEYGIVISIIADGYFNDEGEFDPTAGMLNTMYAFYKFCYKKDDSDIDTAEKMAEIAEQDGNFLFAYNDALDCDVYVFNFANAYREATELISYRKESAVLVLNKIKAMIESASKYLSDLTAEKMDEISNTFKDAGVSVNDIGNILQSIAGE